MRRPARGAAYILMDRSAERRFGPFAVGEYREILGRAVQDHRHARAGAASFTTTPIVFMDFKNAQELLQTLQGKTQYVLVKLAPGADAAAVAARDPPTLALQRRLHARTSGRAARAPTGWSRPASGMNMGVTVFLGILVGIVVVAQTLYTSAVEHVKEFGTVKAIGGSNWDIYRILGEQALIAAVVGFVLGRRSCRSPCGPLMAEAAT